MVTEGVSYRRWKETQVRGMHGLEAHWEFFFLQASIHPSTPTVINRPVRRGYRYTLRTGLLANYNSSSLYPQTHTRTRPGDGGILS